MCSRMMGRHNSEQQHERSDCRSASPDIIVTKPGTGLCVTYRRVLNEPVLEALCSMRGDPDAKALKFLTEAWNAAHAKAKALGWLAAQHC